MFHFFFGIAVILLPTFIQIHMLVYGSENDSNMYKMCPQVF